MKIEIYSKNGCPYCVNAKNACKAAGHEYTEYTLGTDVTKADIQARVNALGLSTEVKTVPQIFIDDTYVGGYSDLIRLHPWAHEYHSKSITKK